MVSTQRQVIEKMLGRGMSDKEWNKAVKMAHKDALIWAKNLAIKEGRKCGY